ncbi:hypothetical protein TSUD_202210 [Trifolium subterraneum]|uniref:RNA polymerase II C-terminal domain phosphatase-like n=1 Tax=Trifolium subterraneum TaxID=3900 RepID=A0A2Z6LKK7_TRISU|nr:hypothetical protein TSUD_202210 [Trifolium subterraneum]
MTVIQMSVVTDSPVHSSGSDDFIDYLNEALDASSPNSSSDEEAENQDEFEDLSRSKRRKFASSEETEGSTSEGIVEQKLVVAESSVVKVDGCTHPGSFGKLCICCGETLDGESGVTFGYIHKGLRLHNEEVSRLRNTEMKKFLYSKKLFLVLDLDHTLLNTTILGQLSSEELHLLNETDSREDVSKGSLFKLEHMHMMTKLRPFVRTFLKEASAMFEMYIYTMGDRPYALEMAKLLDPEREYFNAKVISRDDGTQKHQKGLDIVLGQESAVLILDDTEHKLQGDLVDRDVRQVLSSVRGEILSGCVIIFSRINHLALPTLKRIAEQLGATCLTELDPTVTHVVATDAGTEKARWAVKEKKYLVHPRWIEAANYFWQKQPEENFVIKKTTTQS